ncbi:MAG: TonB-dependent receptor plug domain-containing protein [Alphaproteobacteria bacterium]|nr:TonB-dependent receptor plug domain-containing protein [Alphaproteobacteria bacterium]
MIAWLLAAAWAGQVELVVRQHGDAAPLPRAEVVVQGTPVALDARGRATLELPDGVEATVVLTSLDHQGQTLTFTPPLDQPLVVFLRPLSEPGEIVVEAFRPTAEVTRHHVDAEMAYETPGTFDDAVRLVQALPGVNVQREYSPSSGDVSVRGSLAGDSRFYLDGIEVPYLYHFNQYASVFPASQLDSLDLYPSGYGARYGDATGAIVEAVSKTDRPDDITGSAGINLVTVGGDLRAPLPKGWWVSAAFRRSFHDIVTQGTDQFPTWPRFYDFSARAEHVGERTTVGIFTAGSGDTYGRVLGELDVLDPYEQEGVPTLDFGRDWQLLGVRVRWGRGRFVTAFLHDLVAADVSEGGLYRKRSMSLPTRLDADGTALSWLDWAVGGELRPEVTLVELEDAGRYGPLVVREAAPLAWQVAATDATLPRVRFHGYGELQAKAGPARFFPGVRVGMDSVGWSPTIEPRLAVRVRVAEQTELRLGGGRYQQRPETEQLLADPDLPTTDAWSAVLGIDQTIAGRVEIVADGYVKASRDVVWQPVSGRPVVAAHGLAYGAELTVRYRLRDTFFLWAWFAYGRALLHDGSDDGDWFSSDADQPFSGGVVASWNVLPALQLALRYRAATGNTFTDVVGSLYDASDDTWVPRFGNPNGARLPDYHKIDLRVAYTFAFRRWSLQLAADVWIVPPPATALYPTWSYDYGVTDYVQGPIVLPLLGLRATF